MHTPSTHYTSTIQKIVFKSINLNNYTSIQHYSLNWFLQTIQKKMSAEANSEVQLVDAPPQEPPTVVHIDKVDAAQALFDAKQTITKETAEQNETLKAAWKEQKMRKRELVAAMGVGDQIILPDGTQLEKARKPNRDLNADAIAAFMHAYTLSAEEAAHVRDTNKLPDSLMVAIIEAGYTYREVLLRAPPAKRVHHETSVCWMWVGGTSPESKKSGQCSSGGVYLKHTHATVRMHTPQ